MNFGNLRLVTALAACGLTLAGAACSAESGGPNGTSKTPPASGSPDAGGTQPAAGISWSQCEVPAGDTSYQADCALVDMPARRGVPNSGTVPVAVYRVKAPVQPARGQLWMLNGGPGGSGIELVPYGDLLARSFAQGLDVYSIDHRGTGESAFLGCPNAEATSDTIAAFGKACSDEIRAQYGDKLDGFSTTESAHDVRELIDATKGPGQKVFIYGVSYGSYWAHRILQLPGLQVDAVVTEGNCISTTCNFNRPQTFGMDEVMKTVLAACKQESECTAKLGSDPEAFARNTLALLKNGHCSAATFSTYAPADMIFAVGPNWPQGTLPLLYRLNRCNANDVVVLNRFEKTVAAANDLRPVRGPNFSGPPVPTEERSGSAVLGMHVIASELISRPAPKKAELDAAAIGMTFLPNTEVENDLYDAWMPYPRDSFVGGWMKRDVPWLMLQGDFDFQTVFSKSEEALKYIEDPQVRLVRIHGGNHSVVFDGSDTKLCARSIMEAFLANPGTIPDTSCDVELQQKQAKLDPDYVKYFLGGGDGWD